jgi:glycine/D-amino acid oxidase-like deaminating enzyme
MKDQARVVVIGGGIFGVNIAYHLAKTGTRLEIEVFGEKQAAEVAAAVLYDPQGERLRE